MTAPLATRAHTGPGLGTSSNEPASVAGVRHITKRVLAVVLVVAPAQARRAEAFAFVEMDRHIVGAANLQREAGAVVLHPLV